jgi:hypothetical protein
MRRYSSEAKDYSFASRKAVAPRILFGLPICINLVTKQLPHNSWKKRYLSENNTYTDTAEVAMCIQKLRHTSSQFQRTQQSAWKYRNERNIFARKTGMAYNAAVIA